MVAAAACAGKNDRAVPPPAGAVAGKNLAVPGGQASANDGSTCKPGRLTGARLLTNLEYANTIRFFLGEDISVLPGVPTKGPVAGHGSMAALRLQLPAEGVERAMTAAAEVARQAVASSSGRDRLSRLAGCTPAGPTDNACAARFVASVGRLLFRRPLDDVEKSRFRSLFGKGMAAYGDFWGGAELALAAFVGSPSFLYLSEIGQSGPEATEAKNAPYLRGYELAARMSYALGGLPPPPALLDAAGRGELDTAAGIRLHAERLIDGRGAGVFDALFEGWLALGNLREVDRLGADVRAAMRQETLRVLQDAAFGADGGLAGALTARTTYLNDTLARHYRMPLPGSAEMVKVSLPADGPRAGILGHGTFLAPHTSGRETSPTKRGLAVLDHLLCEEPPAMPDSVTNPKSPPGPSTARDVAALRIEDGYCGSCHEAMDPLGLAFEHFDAHGRYRKTDKGLPIDPSGELDGVAFQDAAGLAALVAERPEFAVCVVKQVYRHSTGWQEEDAQKQRLEALGRRFATGGFNLRSLFLDLVADPLFSSVGVGP